MTETLIVIVFVAAIFTFLYVSVIPLVGTYNDKVVRESNIDVVYKLYHLRNLMTNDNAIKNIINNNDVYQITCDDYMEKDKCDSLIASLELTDYTLLFIKNMKDNVDSLNTTEYKEIYDLIENKEDDEAFLILYDKLRNTYAKIKYPYSNKLLVNIIKKKCNDSTVTYVKKFDKANQGGVVDTYDDQGDGDVCYYTGPSGRSNGNVILGDYCWQIVRTTEHGATKLLYNGHRVGDTCPDSAVERINDTVGLIGGSGTQSTNVSGTKLYGRGFDYNGTTFTLTRTFTGSWSSSTYQDMVGTYTCMNNEVSCTSLYYIGHYQSNTNASTVRYTIGNLTDYATIGTSPFNAYSDSASLAGYMYNDTYNLAMKNLGAGKAVITLTYIYSEKYYGDQVIWNSETNKYDLKVDDGTGNYVTPEAPQAWADVRSSAKGRYVCLNELSSSCSTVYYMVMNSNSTAIYAVGLSNGDDYTKTISWTIGSGYTKEGSTYTLTGVSTLTIPLKDWYDNYRDPSYRGYYVCSDYASTTCTILYYIGTTDKFAVHYNIASDAILFGNSVTYEDGHYKINYDSDPTKYQVFFELLTKYGSISNSHYTCLSTSDVCDSVYYVFNASSANLIYIRLQNGEKIEDVTKKMFNYKQNATDPDYNINVHNSAIKGIIDNWYGKNIYSTVMEGKIDRDTVYCNDRSISLISGWNPNGGSVTGDLYFKNSYHGYYGLGCSNLTDRFSASSENTNAQLLYPVGLLNPRETQLMDIAYTITKNGVYWWTSSPVDYVNYAGLQFYNVIYNGGRGTNYDYNAYTVRPAIALKGDVEVDGKGTYDEPYIVDLSEPENIDF